jgi:hypothetical protein
MVFLNDINMIFFIKEFILTIYLYFNIFNINIFLFLRKAIEKILIGERMNEFLNDIF